MPASSMNRRDLPVSSPPEDQRLSSAIPPSGVLRAAHLPRRSPARPGLPAPWTGRRCAARFLMPPELSVMNAANLCPSPASTLQAVYDYTERMDREPVPSFRGEMHGVKEPTRDRLAEFLGVTPEEILITRNTSEANNWVSTGLQLGWGDEVVIVRDNHPSNNLAWKAKGQRFGYTVREIEPLSPHPGADYYVQAFSEAITPSTRVIAFTHLTNTARRSLPGARAVRAGPRARHLLGGGRRPVLRALQHRSLRGAAGLLFRERAQVALRSQGDGGAVRERARPRTASGPPCTAPTAGRGDSRAPTRASGSATSPAIRAFGAQIEFLQEITMAEVEARSRELATALVEELSALEGRAHVDLAGAVAARGGGHLPPG